MDLRDTRPVGVLDNDILRTFVAIAETGSFAAAAEAVFRTPSAVSMQIKRLEEQVGTTLFLREARSVRLTQGGERLLGYARRMLALSNEAMAHFRTPDIEGVVRLGATDDIGERILPGMLKRFAEVYPGVTVDVTIDNSIGLYPRLREQRIDLALVNSGCDSLQSMNHEVLMAERLVWVGAKGGAAYLQDPLPVSMWDQGCAWRREAVRQLEAAGRPYRLAYLSASTMVQRVAVESDLAVAPMARYYVGDDMDVLGEEHGLPRLGEYEIHLVFGERRTPVIEAVAEAVRYTFRGAGAHMQAA
ncbi:LysR substrate-binding domain-containing protein [Martelella sp. HB161492]|uniref:LysR substrate-binding domain-containing protein n=1 Tax=Martelella sp. HB161492 TaxID=2720726 RepID=UPI0015922238|nr:LysR substrate-binding domain-containing protein [Martelella sp. HB161492]